MDFQLAKDESDLKAKITKRKRAGEFCLFFVYFIFFSFVYACIS